MPGRAESLYSQINDTAAIDGLINTPEDGHLDCKEWSVRDKDNQEILAKAVSGLANADGGVLVIGMKAKAGRNGEPDIITDKAPVSDTSQVHSRVLTLIGNIVEPPIVGIETREIPELIDSTSGFVIIYVPKSEGPPHRSRKDSDFYVRVGSVTLPMEYWQIEDRFGTRPHPKLELHLEERDFRQQGFEQGIARFFVLGLKNSGSGIAKFPGLTFRRASGFQLDPFGIDGNRGFGIRQRASEPDLFIFGGGVDDVIYPEQTLLIAKIYQYGKNMGRDGTSTRFPSGSQIRYAYGEALFTCNISCEGCPTVLAEKLISATSHISNV